MAVSAVKYDFLFSYFRNASAWSPHIKEVIIKNP